jgi:hypothetical protein
MPRDFIPRRDAEFLGFTSNLRAKLAAAPDPLASLGISPEQVAHYALTQETFAAAYRAAITPGTRTSPAVTAKKGAREALEADTRVLARIIHSFPAVTDQMRVELGLCVRRAKRKRVPRPGAAPGLIIESMRGRTAKLRLVDRESTHGGRGGRPRDSSGALLLYYMGEQPPADPLKWSLLRQTSRARVNVTLSVPPCVKVWLTAGWLGTRNQVGPLSTPVSTYISEDGPAIGANSSTGRAANQQSAPAHAELKRAA